MTCITKTQNPQLSAECKGTGYLLVADGHAPSALHDTAAHDHVACNQGLDMA